MRADERLTKASVSDGTFTFLWKAQFDNRTRGMHSLTPPVLLDRLIGYRGFKALAFVGGSADRVFAIDTDLNKPYWNVQLNYAAATGGPPPITAECPGALTAIAGPPDVARAAGVRTEAAARAAQGAKRGRRTGPRRRHHESAAARPRTRQVRHRHRRPAARGGRARGAVAGVPFGGVDPLYVVGTDGFLRVLRTSDGTDAEPGVPFVPPGAMPSALVFIDGAVYTTTSNGCGVSPNGVWMIDSTSPDRAVTSWRTGGPNIVGTSGLAFGTDGTVFVAVARPTSGGRQPATTSSVRELDRRARRLDAHGEGLVLGVWRSVQHVADGRSARQSRSRDRRRPTMAGCMCSTAASLGGANHRTPLHVTRGLQRCRRRRLAGDVGIAGHAVDSGAGGRCAQARTRLRRQRTVAGRTDRDVQAVGNGRQR